MADENQIGLQAIFDDEDFQKGIADYNAVLSDSVTSTDSAAGAMQDALSGLSETGNEALGTLSTGAEQANQNVGASLGGIGEAAQNTETTTTETSTSIMDAWDGLSSAAKEAFAAASVAVAGLIDVLVTVEEKASDAEEVFTRMDYIVGKTSATTGVTSQYVKELADSLSQVYPIDDDVIMQAVTMGLTFQGVTRNDIEPMTRAAADLAAFTGGDMVSSMKALGFAIADPDRALRLFRQANITVTDAEKAHMKTLKDTGNEAGMLQFIMQKLADKGIGGLGLAMGQTTEGKMTRMQTAIENMQEALGAPLLGPMGAVEDMIGSIANALTGLLSNQPIAIGAITAITAAIIALTVTALAPFVATLTAAIVEAAIAAAPIIAVILAISAVVALLAAAWEQDWGGIREEVQAAWIQIKPVFDQLSAWLGSYIPLVIQALGAYFSTVLLPVVQIVFGWIVSNVLPILVQIVLWLGQNVPAAIQAVSVAWTTVLLPALGLVWSYLNTYILPLFRAVADLVGAVVGLAVRALAGIWQNVLLPALVAVWGFIAKNIIPLFQQIGDIISTYVMPILGPFAQFIAGPLVTAFESLGPIIIAIANAIEGLADSINNLSLPSWMTPGSPTPWEIGLVGINKQLEQLAKASLPALRYQIEVLASVRDARSASGNALLAGSITNSQSTQNYLFGSRFEVNSQSSLTSILNGLR